MQRAVILTENGEPIFRYDVKPHCNNDDLEMDIAQFIVQLAHKKGMVNPRYVIRKIEKLEHLSLGMVLDFFSEPANVRAFMSELKRSKQEIDKDLKVRFSRANIRRCLREALDEA